MRTHKMMDKLKTSEINALGCLRGLFIVRCCCYGIDYQLLNALRFAIPALISFKYVVLRVVYVMYAFRGALLHITFLCITIQITWIHQKNKWVHTCELYA